MTNDKKTAVFAGSFNPITLGHIDVLKAGAEMFDRVIIAIAHNPDKEESSGFLSVDERKTLIKECIKNISNVEVDSFSGLTVDYAKRNGAKFLIRGVRSVSDFEYEIELAHNNNILSEDIKTIFIPTKPEHSFISSGAVREILTNKGDFSKLVPKEVLKFLKK